MRLTRIRLDYFKKFIQSEIDRETGYFVKRALQPLRRVNWRKWRYTENRPWTDAAKQATRMHRQVLVDPVKEWTIYNGDRVQVLVGKDKGKLGLVDCIVKERSWCFVTGLNCEYEWLYKTSTNPGQVIKRERPLMVTTEVALVDPSDDQPTPVEWRYTEEGDRVRVSLRTGHIIPLAAIARSVKEDMVDASAYTNQACDTGENDLKKITFVPKLCTFEQDIMSALGIVDTRRRAATYWY